MPYINSTVTIELSKEKKDIIKTKLGGIITEIPGKSEEWLMIGFNDNKDLYFKGELQNKAAFIEVKVFGAVEKKYKEIVSKHISNLFETELGISKDKIYIIFQEIEDWAWNGDMF